jgi:gamma-glutamyltranspeptidase / glutathione hydrolase
MSNIRCDSIRCYTVHSCGTWCQGISLLESLKTLEGIDLRTMGVNTLPYLHTVVEALNLAFADREGYVGDPRFVDVPVAGMLSDEYAVTQRRRIDPCRAFGTLPLAGRPRGATREPFIPRLDSFPQAPPGAALDTTYCCVVDHVGNAYSATLSDNVRDTPVAPSLGGTVSSRGSQSRLEPGHPCEVKPGKRPRMTPAPALVLRGGEFYMALGTPGGDVQTQAMLQAFLNIVEFGMTLQQAVEQPRVGTFNFPSSFSPHAVGSLNVEQRFSPKIAEGLKALGHKVGTWSALAPAAGAVCVIARDPRTGWLHAAADPRREAYAMVS